MKFNKKISLNADFDTELSITTVFENKIAVAGQSYPETQESVSMFCIFDTTGNLLTAESFRRTGKIKVQTMKFDTLGNLFFGGVAYDIFEESGFLIKWNEQTGAQWSKAIQHPDGLEIKDIQLHGDKIFLSGNLIESKEDAFVIQMDDSASIEEVVFMPNTISIQKVISTADKNFVIAGFNESGQIEIFELENTLSAARKTSIDIAGSTESRVTDIIANADGDLFLSGYSDLLSSPGNESFILNWKKDSVQADLLTIQSTNDIRIIDLIQLPDSSGFKALGSSEFYGNGIDNGIILDIDSFMQLEKVIVADRLFGSKFFGGAYLSNDALFIYGNRDLDISEDALNAILFREGSWEFCDYSIQSLPTTWQSVSASSVVDSFSSFSLSTMDLLAATDTIPYTEKLVCLEGDCQTEKPQIIWDSTYCIGDTLSFEVLQSYEDYSWFIDGSRVSRDSVFTHVFDGDSTKLGLVVEDGLDCKAYSGFWLVSEPSNVSIIGPTEVCINEGIGCYSFLGTGSENLLFQIENGEIIQSGNDSICVEWDYGPGVISTISIDSAGCGNSVSHLYIEIDSGNLQKPNLYLASIDTSVELTRLYFDLVDYQKKKEDLYELKRLNEGIWEPITRLLEDESTWISPNPGTFESFMISGNNDCGFLIESDHHKPIELRYEDRTLKWSPYSAWHDAESQYSLISSLGEMDVTGKMQYKPNDEREFSECYRLKANNEALPGLTAFSNEICLSELISLVIPNVITPNGDGLNDRLVIENLNYFPEHHLSIYNRWGRELFSSADYENSWPTDALESGTYFYHLKVARLHEEQHLKGWIEVLK